VGAKMLDFRQITLFCLESRLSKHKMTIRFKNLGGAMALQAPLATPMYTNNWLYPYQSLLEALLELEALGLSPHSLLVNPALIAVIAPWSFMARDATTCKHIKVSWKIALVHVVTVQIEIFWRLYLVFSACLFALILTNLKFAKRKKQSYR